MKKFFLVLSTAASLFSGVLYAQTSDAAYQQKIKQLYEEVKKNPVLRNFDVEKNWSIAVSRHSDPNVQQEIFNAAKNRYISERLTQQSGVQSRGDQPFSYSYDPANKTGYIDLTPSASKTPPPTVASSCVNSGFENQNYTNWTGGTYTNSAATNWNTLGNPAWTAGIMTQGTNQLPQAYWPGFTSPYPNRHTIMTIPPTLNTPPTCIGWDSIAIKPATHLSEIEFVPATANGVTARLGNADNNYNETERLVYTMTVNASNSQFTFSYAVIIYDGGHAVGEQPFFKITTRDAAGNPINGCGQYQIDATQVSTDPSFTAASYWNSWNSTWTDPVAGGFNSYYYKKWTTVGMDLTAYMGQTVSIEFRTGDCIFGGHWCYAYVDASCQPAQAVVNMCSGTSNAVLVAPPGYNAYQWYGPNSMTQIAGATNDTLNISGAVVGNVYTVSLINAAGCTTQMQTTLVNTNIQIQSTNSTPSCLGGFSGTASVIPTGSNTGYTYAWTNTANGQNVGNTATVTGLAPGTYSVTVSSANCGSATATVTVGVSPPVYFTNTQNFCMSPAQVAAPTPGSNYVWYNPSGTLIGGANSSTLSVNSPVSGSAYTTVFTTPSGCKDSVKITLTQIVNQLSDTITFCGTVATLTVTPGATNVQWYDSNLWPYSVVGTGNNFNVTNPYTSLWWPSYWGVYTNPVSGCKDSVSVYLVNQPSSVNPSNIMAACSGLNNGSATLNLVPASVYTVTVTGPTPSTLTGTGSTINLTGLAAGSYTVSFNNGQCTATANFTINSSVVNVNATVAPATVCAGQPATVTFTYGAGTPASCGPAASTCGTSTVVTVGTGTLQNSQYGWPTPYGNYYSNEKYQILYTASDLNAAGVTAGKISSIAFNVASIPVGMNKTFKNYTIKMGCTSATSLDPNNLQWGTIPFITPVTTVYGPTNYTIVANWNTHNFTTAWQWDGTSNLVVEICYDWVAPSTYTSAAIVNQTATTYASYLVFYSDGTAACPYTSGSASYMQRPNTRFSTCQVAAVPSGFTYNWTPSTGVTGTAPTVTLTPSVTTSYICNVTSTSAPFCTKQITLPVTVSSPAATATNAGPYCPGQTIQLNSTGGGTYSWSGPGGFTSSLQNPTRPAATAAMSGVYTVTITSGGCTTTATTSVTVNSTLAATATNTGPFCAGQTIQLNATGGGTYAWTGPSAFTSAVQNPTRPTATALMSGVYTVTVNNGGCVGTATTTVTVNPLPIPTASNTGPYCAGTTIQLNSAGGGTYSWSGPSAFTSTLQNPTRPTSTTAMSGIYTVTVTSSGCTATATTTVTVNPLPIPTASNTGPYCPGSAIALTATGGGTYAWSGPNTFTSTSATPAIAGATTAMGGIYTVTVTATGCTATATTSVTVNPSPLPTASNTGPYCPGSTIALTATGGGTYSWNGPNAFTSTSATPTIAGATTAMSGVYTVTATVSGCTATATTSVTVNPTPIPTATNTGPYCAGSVVQLNGTGGTTYAWSGPNAFTSAAQNPSPGTAGPLTVGIYTLTVTANGCTATATTTVSSGGVLVPTLSSNSPVCAGGVLNLSCSNGVSWSWTGPNSFTSTAQNPSIAAVTTAASGTYSITATDASGCTGTGTVTATVNSLPTATAGNSGPYCPGASIALSSGGGATYSWSGPASYTSSTQNPAIAGATTAMTGVYTVTVVSAAGCTAVATTSVTVNPTPTPIANNTGPYCPGSATGLTAAGGGTYSWSGPNAFTSVLQNPSMGAATNAMAGVYTVTVTVAGCTATATTTVSVNPSLVPGLSSNSPICNGDALNLTCSNGTTWAWTGPNGFTSAQQNPVISSSTTAASGTYSVTVTDASGCSGTNTLAVTVNALPNVTVNSSAICLGQTATLTATNAITYSWTAGTSPSTGATVTASPGATTQFTVTGTDANGCVDTAVATVTVNPVPVISVTNTGPYCVNATIQLNATGGVNYAWTGPNGFVNASANPAITPATTADAGQYDVSVTDANGCVANGNTTVVVNTSLIPNLSSNSPICDGASLNLACSNGVSWSWTGPNAFTDNTQNPTISPAAPIVSGTYSISLTDANGCVGSGTISVVVNALPTVTVNSTAICNGQATATLTASGASTYLWTAGTTPSVGATVTTSPSATTSYTVTGTDSNGCTDTSVATVTVNPIPNVTVNSPAICSGFTATINANGALSYAWSAGTSPGNSANETAAPASTTSYTVTGTDANGCVGTAVSTVTVNAQLIVDAGMNDTVCAGNNFTVTATGPAGTTYTWNGGSMSGASQTLPAISTTTMTVNAIDVNGCAGTDSVVIIVPAPIVLNAAGFAATCNGACNGQLVVLASPNTGAFAQYTYAWTPGGYTTANPANVCAANYAVTVTNNAGCVATATASVTEPPAVIASATGVTNATCNGVCDGSATINASGGAGPGYTYSWSSVGTGNNPTNLCVGNYTCTVADVNNCSVQVPVTIVQPSAITVSIAPASTICIGQSATLTATPTGGTPNYVYTWTGGTTTNNASSVTASPVVSASYSVSVTDANGCAPGTASVTVTVNPALSVTASNDVTLCAGQTTGLSATGSGGNGNYTYSWASGTTPGTGSSVTAAPGVTTTYTVTLTDGCGTAAVKDTVLVTVNPLPTLSITPNGPTGCAEHCTFFTANSTPAAASVNWTFSDNQTATGIITNPICFATAGTYGATINVTGINGCQNTYTNNTLVTVYPKPTAEFAFGPQPTTESNPLITFTDQSSGAPVVSWVWDFGDPGNSGSTMQNPAFNYDAAGNYDVNLAVTSNMGCIDNVTHTIIIEPDFALYVPNAFTPGDQDKLNDTFFAKGMGIDTDNFEMSIYDRWGTMIFHTSDFSTGWDGRVKGSSEIVQQDVYVWKIKLQTYTHEKKSFVGHVTVVR